MKRTLRSVKLLTVIGLSLAAFACDDPGDGGGGGGGGNPSDGPTAQELLELTQTCDPLPGVSKFKTDYNVSSTIQICRLNGAIWWRADADIDCDGGSSAECKNDPDYQSTTSAKDSQGNFVDASKVPFLVVPMAGNGFDPKAYGIKTGWSAYGSAGAMIYNGKIVYGPYADAGPAGIIGELSQAAAAKLGIPTSPISGGVSSGVTYIVFTGNNTYVDPIESASMATSLGKSLANTLLENN